jgi:phenylacetate-CoA ligase
MALALQFQLKRSQWLAPQSLQALQFRQLDALARHAYATVPYYRMRWRGLYEPGAGLNHERWARLPVVTRRVLQDHFDDLHSTEPPKPHGAAVESRTSGSTGQPVRTLKTALVELWWRALTLREHRWQHRDLSGKLAAIRHKVTDSEAHGWGAATDPVLQTGTSATLDMTADVERQLDWLARQAPDYLLTYPSNLAELARRSLERGLRFARLREVRTLGETLDEDTRELVRSAWGVPVTDAYSSDELGYMALQCPGREVYHAQSESVFLEVLDEGGAPCRPGSVGRVVATALHNFAMPLVRYDIGDYAEAGPPCECGRGLPVLSRILGRVRNTLVLRDGRRYWPTFGSRGLGGIAPVRQHQFVQTDFDVIEARLVTVRPLTPGEEAALRAHVLSRLPAPFELRFAYVGEIARSASGKFEDFMSDVAGRS